MNLANEKRTREFLEKQINLPLNSSKCALDKPKLYRTFADNVSRKIETSNIHNKKF